MGSMWVEHGLYISYMGVYGGVLGLYIGCTRVYSRVNR